MGKHTQNLLATGKQSTKTCFKINNNKNRFYPFSIIDVCRLNLFNTAVFIHKIKNRTDCPVIIPWKMWAAFSFLFNTFFEFLFNTFFEFLFNTFFEWELQKIIRKCRFRISIRGPAIWKDLVGSTEKEIQLSSDFKTKIKSKLLIFENEVTFFWYICFQKVSLTEASTDGNNVF